MMKRACCIPFARSTAHPIGQVFEVFELGINRPSRSHMATGLAVPLVDHHDAKMAFQVSEKG